MEHILRAKLAHVPGKKYAYNNTASILLGFILERVSGKKLDVLSEQYFFGPLNMNETTFHPKTNVASRIPPTEVVDGMIIRGVVHDESARIFSPKAVGSAGLFSTADDLLTVFQMFLNGGVIGDQVFFQKPTVASMFVPAMTLENHPVGLGWEMDGPWMGRNHTKHAIGKTGFTGCFVLCDKGRGVGIVMLSNHTFPHRPEKRDTIHTFRARLIDLILSSTTS